MKQKIFYCNFLLIEVFKITTKSRQVGLTAEPYVIPYVLESRISVAHGGYVKHQEYCRA